MQQIEEQLELHTEAYINHRRSIILKLSNLMGKRTPIIVRFDGENKNIREILLAVMHDTEKGKRFVRQTSLNPDVQL